MCEEKKNLQGLFVVLLFLFIMKAAEGAAKEVYGSGLPGRGWLRPRVTCRRKIMKKWHMTDIPALSALTH